ncbi:MAG: hypothetical protein ABIP61_01395, partial [Burkholderiaceae bacterium]
MAVSRTGGACPTGPRADLDLARSLAVHPRANHHANDLSTIRRMHIKDLDLNLLRIFDAVYRQRSVSRA